MDNTEVVLLANNTKDSKNSVQTEVHVMREVNIDEQIDGLLFAGQIKEARDIFINRQKNMDKYIEKLKQFNLDAGWQMLNTGHPGQIKQYFKQTDVDPRELILLFK